MHQGATCFRQRYRNRSVLRFQRDLGAWLALNAHEAIGLHFAGSDVPERALAIDIVPALSALDVELETGGVPAAGRSAPSIADQLLADVRRRMAVYA